MFNCAKLIPTGRMGLLPPRYIHQFSELFPATRKPVLTASLDLYKCRPGLKHVMFASGFLLHHLPE